MKTGRHDRALPRAALLGALTVAFGLMLGARVAVAAEAAVPARPEAAPPGVLAFDRFIAASSPTCLNEPSARCLDVGWHFADANRDGTLSLAEIKTVRAALQNWLTWKGDAIPARERTNVTLGLIVLDVIGLDKLFASLNVSGTGKLTRAELLADVKLDNRPLGQVLQDPKAVDRKAVAAKLGRAAPVVGGMMDGSESGAARK